jgi:hypothetical protein
VAGSGVKVTLGPSGYDVKGKSALVVAGTASVVLRQGDYVVVCRATRMGWEQAEHAVDGASAAGDIVPPFVVVSRRGKRTPPRQ